MAADAGRESDFSLLRNSELDGAPSSGARTFFAADSIKGSSAAAREIFESSCSISPAIAANSSGMLLLCKRLS
jgi:hypothetical protein